MNVWQQVFHKRSEKERGLMKIAPFLVILFLMCQLLQSRWATKQAAALLSSGVSQHAGATEVPPFPYMPNTLKEAMQLIMWHRQHERATFIQIGANDGMMFDPLYEAMGVDLLESRWIGIQVEPSPVLFGNVTNLHRNASGWSFYNGAMANSTQCMNGTVTFFEGPKSGIGDHWTTQGQLNTLNAATPHRSVLAPTTRSCLTSFDNLLQGYASPEFVRRTLQKSMYHVDLLVIDVEGFDDKIIELINWDTMSPHCIQFETFHLKNATIITSFLKEVKGYTLKASAMDMLACRVSPAEHYNVK